MTNDPPEDLPPTGSFEERDRENASDDQDFSVKKSVTRIGRYEILKQLGQGGYGNVYLAVDPDLHRQVAIKVPRWDRPLTEDAIRQFLQEGKMLAQANHPTIVGVHDVGTTPEGIPYVVMEFVEGKSLSHVIKNEPLNLDQMLQILLKVAAALQQAHKKGLVHRDFKPGNVIVDEEGQIHLVDFGLALHDELSGDELESGRVEGTPNFMAPEQIRGENHLIDGQTDIWAFGVTMYRILVGVYPFHHKITRELMKAICYKNPKPLRQRDENVPKQLERICLRCLQKLIEDRYQSMADVIDELEAFVEDRQTKVITPPPVPLVPPEQPSESKGETDAPTGPPTDDAKTDPSNGPSKPKSEVSSPTQSNLKITPKGLRSFDQTDKDFFLQLLPGPTDRLGVPESIQFWLNRLGQADQVDEIPVGVIYGPSGCGKSSFVRAGLLPRLPNTVNDVYIDCTTDNLESHMVDKLTRSHDGIPKGESLVSLIRRIRQGQYIDKGHKILLVLDQFEQWLSSTSDLEQQELTEALRQCDPDRVQVLLLIRDEFWLSCSQFLKLLGQRLEEKRNAMPLPLFDKRHARKVLRAMGRAYELLPPEEKPLTDGQQKFIRKAVDSLADRDRVICVHLAVFAETTRNAEWDISHLRAMGGWQGIGREYVAGIFGNPETPSFIQRHSQEAWGILKQLLPQNLQSLKGVSVDATTLFENSDVPMSPSCFDELLRFLEMDCDLISRTENRDEDDSTDGGQTDEPRFGLTHDFLVAPIREWGSAKQNETMAGRATSDLKHLADQWEITKDRRFLPSLWDYGRFALFADRKVKTDSEAFWSASRRRFLLHLSIQAAAIWALIIIVFTLVGSQRAKEEADLLANYRDYLGSLPSEFESRLSLIKDQLDNLENDLWSDSQSQDVRKQYRARIALLLQDPSRTSLVERMVNQLDQLDHEEHLTLRYVIENSFGDDLSAWRKAFEKAYDSYVAFQDYDEAKHGPAKLNNATAWLVRCSRLAITLAELNEPEALKRMMEAKANPWDRSMAMLELGGKWHGTPDALLKTMQSISKKAGYEDLLSGYLSSLGLRAQKLREEDNTSLAVSAEMENWLGQIYRNHDHGGVHYACWFAMSKLGIDHPTDLGPGNANRQWRVEKIRSPTGYEHELHMVKIPGGKLEVGAGIERYNRMNFEIEPDLYKGGQGSVIDVPSFWISVFETSHRDFREFLRTDTSERDFISDQKNKEEKLETIDDDLSRLLPVFKSSWKSAAAFTNYVNGLFTKPIRYPELDDINKIRVLGKSYFRLPREHEFEWAWRSRSKTRFIVGPTSELLKPLCGIDTRKKTDSGSYPPNAFGCFDMTSNEAEWVEEIDARNRFLPQGILKGTNRTANVVQASPAEILVAPIRSLHSFRLATDTSFR